MGVIAGMGFPLWIHGVSPERGDPDSASSSVSTHSKQREDTVTWGCHGDGGAQIPTGRPSTPGKPGKPCKERRQSQGVSRNPAPANSPACPQGCSLFPSAWGTDGGST